MIIHYNENDTLEVYEDDSSYRQRRLMEKETLVLKFSLTEWVDIPINAWVEYENERFFLMELPSIKKNGERNIEYTLNMVADDSALSLYKFINPIDRRVKWSMCAKPWEFIKAIIDNLNEREGAEIWHVGECVEANEKTIEFNHTQLDEALQEVAETFETEWEISNRTISLKKVEYFKESPLSLSYGKGNGFVPGVGRSVADGEQPIKRLYVQGGDRNIDPSKYNGQKELRLPKGKELQYNGRTYRSDADGLYIERTDVVSDAAKEDSLDCDELYPSHTCEVTAVQVVNENSNLYDIFDNTIPQSLDYSQCLIAGQTPYIRFQTGMLAGEKDFQFRYKHNERKFELVAQEIDGVMMPNKTFAPKVGDEFVVFGIMLPEQYVCDDDSKTGASWDMFREAAKHLYENEEQKFTFTGTLQGLWAKRNWLEVGGKLKVGAYVNFTDNQFAKDGVMIRIVGVKDFLNNPHAPQLELSNGSTNASISSQLAKIDKTEVTISDAKNEMQRFTKRTFADAKGTLEMLQDALLDYSSGINPVSVSTMAMLIGDESLQFRFVESPRNSRAGKVRNNVRQRCEDTTLRWVLPSAHDAWHNINCTDTRK